MPTSTIDWHATAEAVDSDQYVPALAGLLTWLSRSVSISQVEHAIETGKEILPLFPLDRYFDFLGNALMRIQEDVYKTVTPIATMLALTGVSRTFALPTVLERRFDLQDEEAQEFIKTRTGNRIRDIDPDVKHQIRAIILESFQKGGHPREQARRIVEHIALLPNQRAAYERFRDARMKQANTQRQRDQATRGINAHYAKLIRERARTIARTETMMASNESTMRRWDRMYQDGKIPAGTQLRWVPGKDEKLCDLCSAMSGKLYPFGHDFVLPNGNIIAHPPAHPRCRCVLTLVRPDILDDPEVAALGSLDQVVADAFKRLSYTGTPRLDMSLKPGDRISNDITDVKDLEATMRTLYPDIDFDMGKADAQAMLPSMKQFDRLATDWPLAIKSMERIHVREPDYFASIHGNPRVIAHASYNGRYIEFNSRYFKSISQVRADAAHNQGTGWHTKTTKGDPAATTMTHEFGHTLEGWLTGQHSPKAYPVSMGMSSPLPMPGISGTAFFSKIAETSIANLARKAAPSDYGKTDYHEAFAEAFNGYYHQKKADRGVAVKEITRLMEFMKVAYPTTARTKNLTPDDMVARMAKWDPAKPFNLRDFIADDEWIFMGDVPKRHPEHRRVFDLLRAEHDKQRAIIAEFLGFRLDWIQ